MKNALYFLILPLLLPAFGYSQKAYKEVRYYSEFQKINVNFILTDGYPAGSIIFGSDQTNHQKLQFTADGDISQNGNLKLSAINNADKKNADYFIVAGIKPSFAEPPAKLRAKYYTKEKTYSFTLIKQ